MQYIACDSHEAIFMWGEQIANWKGESLSKERVTERNTLCVQVKAHHELLLLWSIPMITFVWWDDYPPPHSTFGGVSNITHTWLIIRGMQTSIISMRRDCGTKWDPMYLNTSVPTRSTHLSAPLAVQNKASASRAPGTSTDVSCRALRYHLSMNICR